MKRFIPHLEDEKLYALPKLFQICLLLTIIGTFQDLDPRQLIPVYLLVSTNTNYSKVCLWLSGTLSPLSPLITVSAQHQFITKIPLFQQQTRNTGPRDVRDGNTEWKWYKIIPKLAWIVIYKSVIPLFSAFFHYFLVWYKKFFPQSHWETCLFKTSFISESQGCSFQMKGSEELLGTYRFLPSALQRLDTGEFQSWEA